MSVTYTAVLEVSEDSVRFSSAVAGRASAAGYPRGRRALGTYRQAVLGWFLEDARIMALTRDNAIAVSTAYRGRSVVGQPGQQRTVVRRIWRREVAGHLDHVTPAGCAVRPWLHLEG